MFDEYFRQYGFIAIFTGLALGVPLGMILVSWILSLSKIKIRPKMPNAIKQSIYECGFEPISGPWNQFNFRYYPVALLFIIFDLEVVFLFPWAISFGAMSREFGIFILIEVVVFIGILALGWIYALKKNVLNW
ncbi:MAG: NADH-quinone oxidoreductase subunit A [Chloroflexi bacterium]|nr:NADH-quinone oxidoreductase subunit A [Chloroflexota bacterium]|tara:strand:- start:903 stop:1301 length:399 start_codon:yes stop_codon:yes gene_type:complete